MPKKRRRRKSNATFHYHEPSGGKFKLAAGTGLTLYGTSALGTAATAVGLGVAGPALAVPIGLGVASIGAGGSLIRSGYRKRYGVKSVKERVRGRGGAKKGHAFFGNQYTKIVKYVRSKRRRKR